MKIWTASRFCFHIASQVSLRFHSSLKKTNLGITDLVFCVLFMQGRQWETPSLDPTQRKGPWSYIKKILSKRTFQCLLK